MNLHGGNNLLHAAHSATSSTLSLPSFFAVFLALCTLVTFLLDLQTKKKTTMKKKQKGKHLHIIN